MAASTPKRRTGCSVISTTSSGVAQASSIAVPSRSLRYSGSARPAWRMNHTGVCGTGCLRQARTKAESAVAARAAAASGLASAGAAGVRGGRVSDIVEQGPTRACGRPGAPWREGQNGHTRATGAVRLPGTVGGRWHRRRRRRRWSP